MKRIKVKLLLISLILITILVFTACDKQTASEAFNTYEVKWEDKDYEAMYEILSKDSKKYISKEDFIDRYKNIYDGIGAKDINISVNENDEDSEEIKFDISMNTLAGKVEIEAYEAKMVKEKIDDEYIWLVEWDESLIFPQMSKEDKVRVDTLDAKRGEIYDKFGNGLAINGTRYNIGIYPKLFENQKQNNISKMSQILDIDEERIKTALEKNTNPEYFVPIVKISVDNTILSELLEIEGVKYQEINERIYPGGEAFGALIGYIRPITKEELEKDEENFYNNRSVIGKLGLETVYEKTLRANDGKEIYISKISDGEEIDKIIIAKTRPEDGEDLKLAIDSSLQEKIYEEMDGEVGASSAIDPKSGEVLAMVSSPSFDSNIFSTYLSDSEAQKFDEENIDRLQNRFNDVYSPGSTFKLVTAAIALDKGSIDPSEKINISGKSWQKDKSWGDYKVNRVSQKLSNVDLNDAFVYSDNIYFAMAAIKIGAQDFLDSSKKFGFNEELPVSYPIEKSQIANKNQIDSEVLLANTGYGQGQVLVSPLHLSLIYSSLVNNGDIMKPILEIDETIKSEIWKEDIISDQNKDILLDSLTNVIEDENGTGKEAKINGIKLAGKTGTAELKSSKDEKGKENGWFVAMNVDEPKLVISMMIEGVEGRGGSHFVVPKVKNIIEEYLKK
ncbi:penicillin-binding transpeptidase domain-containing protein [Senegalia sp. (in: firmicutes)]|uniref:penicillin-binding transpeptidase domain-containing protein n=1 Tax=Senegalia sp. (in: firmicutes) TaxID=1924098 RepID=UPI003F9C7530